MYKKYLEDVQNGISLNDFCEKYKSYGDKITMTAIWYTIKAEVNGNLIEEG